MNFSIYAALVCNMNGAEDPMSLFTSILKDIAQESMAKTTAVSKRYNKPWFSYICKILNKIWISGDFPSEWRKAIVW